MKNNLLKAHLALGMANLFYGVNYLVVKEVTPEFIEPFGFISIRVVVGTLLLWAFHAFLCHFYAATPDHLIHKKVDFKDIGKLAILSLFGVAINQMLFFKGLSMTSPINASLIMITAPITVLVVAALFRQERITIPKSLGIFLGMFGAGLIIIYSHKAAPVIGQVAQSSSLGDILVGINAASYALYLVLVKPMMKKYHPFTLLKWIFLMAIIYVLPFGFQEFQAIDWATFEPTTWYCLTYILFCTTFLTYLFNIYALQTLPASIVGIYIYTQPIIATLAAVSLGKDALSGIKIVAACLIFSGVYLASIKKSD